MSILWASRLLRATGNLLAEAGKATQPPITPVPATAPAAPEPTLGPTFVAAFLFFTVLAIWLAVRLRVYQPRNVIGPKRQPDFAPLWPLMVVAIVGFLAWQFGL